MTTASAFRARRAGWKGVAGWLVWGASFCVVAQVPPTATAIGSAEQPTASAEAQVPLPSPPWILHLPSTDPVAFKGVENFDSAGLGSGSMAYPAPNAAGFLAAVIAHSLVNEAARNAQKAKLKEDADRILTPFRSVLSKYTHAELARGVKPSSGGPVGQTLQIDSVPVFALTQDQTALVLDNEVSVKATGVPIYKGVIRVVSAPIAEADPVVHWNRDGGSALRLLASDLLRESIELAASAAKAAPLASGMQQTFRYYEGKTSKVERATLLVDGCARRVLLTLRETLMSVPASAAAGACTTLGTRSQGPEKTSVDAPASEVGS